MQAVFISITESARGIGRVSDEADSDKWAEYSVGILPPEDIRYIELPGGVQLPVNS